MKEVFPVHVVWDDSTSKGGWESAAHIQADPGYGLSPIHSVGYLLEENEQRVVIAQSLCETTQEANNMLIIPRVAIRKLKRIRRKR